MKKLWLIFLLPILAFAQEPSLVITNWRGLNTAKSDFVLEPNELRVCHDARIKEGVIYPRPGVVEVARIAGIDSILGLFTMNYRGGDKQMFLVADSSGVGYGNIYASELNSDVFDLNFGVSTDSTFIFIKKAQFDTLTPDRIKLIDSFFVVNPFDADTIVIVDTSTSSATALTANDSLVARINAHTTLTRYVDAGIGGGGGADTTYYFKEVYSDTNVTFRHSAVDIDFFNAVPQGTYQVATEYAGNFSPERRVSTDWAIQRNTSGAQFNDLAYFVNGQQKGKVFNGDYTSDWPINAPGEMSVIPIKETNNINGEVAYSLVYSVDSSGTEVFGRSFTGFVTPRVLVLSGAVILKNFPVPATSGAADTIFNARLYRSKTTAGRFTESDYLYRCTTFTGLTWGSIQTLIYKDTMPDSSLATAAVGVDSIPVLFNGFTGRIGDVREGAAEHRYGAPRFVAADTAFNAAESLLYNVYKGDAPSAIGVSYIVSYVDTSNLIQSAAGPPLWIFRDSVANDYETQYTIALPRPHNSQRCVKNLWRASVVTGHWDSLKVWRTVIDTLVQGGNPFKPDRDEQGNIILTDVTGDSLNFRIRQRKQFQRWDVTKTGDTIALEYRLLAQLPAFDTIFVDTVSYDSLLKVPDVYRDLTPPTGLEFIFVHKNQLIGVKGSRAWVSRSGKFSEWELFDFASFNLDDGDQLTMGQSFRGGIVFGKNYTAYNFSEDFTTAQITGIPGCVARQSAIRAQGGIFYMSNRGVVSLKEGSSLIGYHQTELLSQRLNNFTQKDFADLSKCVGAYVPEREQIWFCVGDTTYVYDFESDTWATSSLTFAGTTLYDVNPTKEFLPGRSLYFFQAGDSVIYKFNEGHRNPGGLYVNMKLETGPLFSDGNLQQILRYALWSKPETNYTLAALNFYNQGDTLVSVNEAGAVTWSFPAVNRRVSFKDVNTIPAIYYRLVIQSLQSGYPMRDGGIDRIDIWKQDVEETPVGWE